MAPSPELGGQPKAPDKTGAETTNTSSSHEISSTSAAAASNNPPSSSLSAGTKHTSVAGTSTSSATSSAAGSANNNISSSSASTGTSSTNPQQQPARQDSSKIDNMAESDLKALLEEAITYKRPKDREHKSSMFNELLSKTEKEDQEQNFPFRAVQSKRASGRPTQGGSLQDLQEASLHDYYYSEFGYPDYYNGLSGLGVQTSRRSQGSSSVASSGPGGGDRVTNPRQKRYTGSVSSRQREGGSLPSNVNVECPFSSEIGHHHTTGTITKFKKRESGAKSDYGTMLLTAPLTSAGATELISAVAEIAGSTGLCGGIKNTESQLIDGCVGGVGTGHTVIDMGEIESDETQRLLSHDALQQTLYDSSLDDIEGSGSDLYGSSTTTSGGSSTTGGARGGFNVQKKIPQFPAASYTSHAKLEIGEPSSTVRPSSVHHVDKTVSLPLLESNKNNVDITPIQLGSSYQAVKCFVSNESKGEHAITTARVMKTISPTYIATQSLNQVISSQHNKYLDENGNSVQQFNSGLGSSSSSTGGGSGGASGNNSSAVGGIGASKKKKQPKSDRNTVLVIPENIAGYRGKDPDIESLVCYIENIDKQKDSTGGGGGGGGGGGSGGGGSGANPKNGTVVKVSGTGNGHTAGGIENGVPEEKTSKKKNEKKKDKAKIKKCNSLEELSSCSRKKQQAEDDQSSVQQCSSIEPQQQQQQQEGQSKTQEMESVVTLRNSKGNKKLQNSSNVASATSSSASSTTSSQSSKEAATVVGGGGKRGERRSWGTEELGYLEEQQPVASSAEKVEEKPSKKENRKEAKDITEAVLPTFNLSKKRDSLRMSVESLSAISAGGGSETAEFHVVTKKKKMKKKSQGLLTEEGNQGATGGYSASGGINATGKRHLSASQSYSIGGSGTRNTNITGKYQTSNTFTNDRDVYMNSLASGNDVSRRKSTSSVPPSEKSDSSDADSVQSLPIEPSRKQQQQQAHQGNQSNRNSSGVPQSYADIAKIPNADKINNTLSCSSASNSTSPLDSSSVDKWPPVQATSEDLAEALKSPSAFPELVPESSLPSAQQQQTQQQYQQNQYVNSSVSSVNSSNVGNNNKATYSQSLLISSTKAEEDEITKQRSSTAASVKLVSSVNSEQPVNSSSNASNSSTNSSSSSSSKLALHKSKSVDNNDIYYSNEHYPALEKTVKPAKVVAPANATSNSLQESKASSVGKVGPTASSTGPLPNPTVPIITAAPVSAAFVSTTNSSIASNTATGAKKSKRKDSASTTNVVVSVVPNEAESINNARNVAPVQPSLLDVANNNNNNPLRIESIENTTAEYTQIISLSNRSPNSGMTIQQHQSTPKSNNNTNTNTISSTNTTVSTKRNKKEKTTSNPTTVVSQSNYATPSHNSMAAAPIVTANVGTTGSNPRPAVIIMNDNNESNPNHEFTFGFDINQELLFEDFHETDASTPDHQLLQYQPQHQYQYHQQNQHHQQQQQPPLHHSSSTENVPSPTGNNTSAQSADLGYSSMQQSSISSTSPSSNSSQQHKHHYHNQQQPDTYEMLNNSSDPDTYRDSMEHKFHQPPPPVVLPPGPLYTQPPPQLPPPHVLAAQQQSRQSRPASAATTNQYNLPPPPVIPGHMQQQPPPVLPTKQDCATNTPTVATSPPAIITVPPPPLPPVVPVIPVVPAVPVVATGAIPVVVAQPVQAVPATVVILPTGPPPNAIPVNATGSSSASNSPATSVCNSNASLSNQMAFNSSSASSSCNSICGSTSGSQNDPKPQRQTQPASGTVLTPANQQQQQQQQMPSIREKIKEINLRFIAPEMLQTNHNHDKIVNFVGMAWEDIICGTNGSAKYYDGQ